MKKFMGIWLLLLPLGLQAAVSREMPMIEVVEDSLNNGLKILLIEDHSAPVVNLQVWVHVGSRVEDPGELGLTHMFEHMMFKGSRKYGPGEHSAIVQANGGRNNAYTTEDVTVFHETVPADRLELVIALEAERMHNLDINADNLASELKVVRDERLMRTDNSIHGTLSEQLSANSYIIHPYHNPVIGWLEDIEHYNVESCRRFYRRWYVPNNMTVVVAGDFRAEEAREIIDHYFGPMPRRELHPRRVDRELPQRGERRIVYHMETQQPLLAVAYHTVALRDSDFVVLEVIATILSNGESSRLYKRLVDGQLATWAWGSQESMEDPGLFDFWISPMPGVAPEETEAALYEELERLAREPVSARELQKAKNKLEDRFIFNLQNTEEKATLVGHYQIRAGDYHLANTIIPRTAAVTAADIQRCAARYFTADNRTVVTILPPNEEN